jgi:hypothetical protein
MNLLPPRETPRDVQLILIRTQAASRLFPYHGVPTFFSRDVSYGFLSETDLAELGVESVHFRAVRMVEDARELVGEVPF